jgi:hypothetical protein
MHHASLYQMNDPPETTTSRHCAFHHARPQHVRIRSILERSRNGTPCLTVLSAPESWILQGSAPSLNLNDTVFICTIKDVYTSLALYTNFTLLRLSMFKFLCAHPKSGRIVNQLTVAIKWEKKKYNFLKLGLQHTSILINANSIFSSIWTLVHMPQVIVRYRIPTSTRCKERIKYKSYTNTAGNRHKQNSWFCKAIREDNFRFWWRRVHEDASQGMYMSEIEIFFFTARILQNQIMLCCGECFHD